MIRPRRQRTVVVPVDLGGSPTPCRVRPPLRRPPDPDTVRALVEHYARERRPAPDTPMEVAFFHGGMPPVPLARAAHPHPLRLSCSPADASREQIEVLRALGLATVEVELLTFQAEVLRDLQRGYSRTHAEAFVRGLKELGLRVGIVLSPGLPGSSHDQALADARRAAGLDDPGLRADLVRIQPALALHGSGLAALARSGRWRPMSLGEAVTTSLEMVEILEAARVPVARLGLQPGSDLPVRAIAGPVHPNLRGLVQARRFRRRMAAALEDARPGSRAVLRVHPKDLSWAKGTANENVRALRARLQLAELALETDAGLPRGAIARVA